VEEGVESMATRFSESSVHRHDARWRNRHVPGNAPGTEIKALSRAVFMPAPSVLKNALNTRT